jgi:hypothetical protein
MQITTIGFDIANMCSRFTGLYKRGDFVSVPACGIYFATVDTMARPGADSSWSLAVKSGRDGRGRPVETTAPI